MSIFSKNPVSEKTQAMVNDYYLAFRGRATQLEHSELAFEKIHGKPGSASDVIAYDLFFDSLRRRIDSSLEAKFWDIEARSRETGDAKKYVMIDDKKLRLDEWVRWEERLVQAKHNQRIFGL